MIQFLKFNYTKVMDERKKVKGKVKGKVKRKVKSVARKREKVRKSIIETEFVIFYNL
jgi:hypothetical protein